MHANCAAGPPRRRIGLGTIVAIVVCAVVAVVWVVQAIPDRPRGTAPPAELVPEHRMLQTYEKGAERWQAVLMTGQASNDGLLALGRMLHRVYPATFFLIVDDAKEVDAYIGWTVHYPSAAHPLPKAWADRHVVGFVRPRPGGGWGIVFPDGRPALDL